MDRSGGRFSYEAGVSDAYSQIQAIFKINNTWFSCWAWGGSEAIGENRQVKTTAGARSVLVRPAVTENVKKAQN